LHGEWIDADQDADAIMDEIRAMLAESPIPGAEEWAIHDYEGFGPLRISEYEAIETVARLGEGIGDHGSAFAHWAANAGTDPAALDEFEHRYLGHWSSLVEFAEYLLDDLGIDLDNLGPDNLQPYIRFDLDAFARDLAMDLHVSEDHDGVHLFEP
jgi:antirestriction protein